MKAHPRTTYVTAGAEAWSLIRGAYLSEGKGSGRRRRGARSVTGIVA